jgi:hypothetical protein
MEDRPDMHRIKIGKSLNRRSFWGYCSCGWIGRPMLSQRAAEDDADEHLILMTREEPLFGDDPDRAA